MIDIYLYTLDIFTYFILIIIYYAFVIFKKGDVIEMIYITNLITKIINGQSRLALSLD